MKKFLIFVLSCGCGVGQLAAAPEGGEMQQDIVIRRMGVKKDVSMDWFFDQPDVLTATRADFEKQFPKGTYAWLDKDKHRARFNPDRLNIKLRNEE